MQEAKLQFSECFQYQRTSGTTPRGTRNPEQLEFFKVPRPLRPDCRACLASWLQILREEVRGKRWAIGVFPSESHAAVLQGLDGAVQLLAEVTEVCEQPLVKRAVGRTV